MNSTEVTDITLVGTMEEKEALLKIAHRIAEDSIRKESYVLRVGGFTCCGLTVMAIKESYVHKNHCLLWTIEGKLPIFVPEHLLKNQEEIQRLHALRRVRPIKKRGLFGEYFHLKFPEESRDSSNTNIFT
ncbi:MAG: hypothetical protein ACFFGZ_16200 [Candidatus Thorarchaeota archaeon]